MSKIACIVAYPSTNKEGGATKFDMDYYLATHMTMIDKYWGPHGMKSWDVKTFPKDKSLDVRVACFLKKCLVLTRSQGSTPPYIVVTTIYWDSLDDVKNALGAPESKETGADVANFTDVYPVIWMADVAGQNKL